MSRKHIVITGASSGIGLEIAKKLITLDNKLWLIIRNPDKIVDLKTELLMISPRANIQVILADLSIMKEVKFAAETILAGTDRVDILFNNAGAIYSEKQITSEGLEMTFATNFLSHFLLTDLLKNALAKSEDARVINVTSEMYRYSKWNQDYLFENKPYDMPNAYANSKLALIYFTQWAAEQWKPLGIKVNCIHPGVVDTAFGSNTKGWINWGMDVIRPFVMSAEKSAKSLVELALSDKYLKTTGEYFKQNKQTTVAKYATDVAEIEALVNFCNSQLNEILSK